MISLIWGFLKIVIILGTLITIHELGHFTVAKLCNVKVNKFSIGFGPTLLKKQKGETEYSLRLFPFGGFVQMEGEEERSEEERAFNKKTVLQRIAIVAAGATVNIIFSLIVYFCIASAFGMYVSNVVQTLESGPLYEAGIRSGDKILSINGDKMLTQREIEEKISASKSDEMTFKIERNEQVYNVVVNIPYTERGNIGVAFDVSGEVIQIISNSPAQEMGLEIYDKVLAVNDEEYDDISLLIDKIRSMKNEHIELKVQKAETGEIVYVSGDTDTKIERIYKLDCMIIKPGFFDGIIYAADETWDFFTATLKGTAEIFVGKTEDVEVMGPVGIAEEITSTSSAYQFFYLMSAISLSLGIFNLLPIPALDGGRIFILIVEGIRRKPLKENVEQAIILIGFAIIMVIAILITVSDVMKIF